MSCDYAALVQSSDLNSLPAANKPHPGFAQLGYFLQADVSTLPALNLPPRNPPAGSSSSHWILTEKVLGLLPRQRQYSIPTCLVEAHTLLNLPSTDDL